MHIRILGVSALAAVTLAGQALCGTTYDLKADWSRTTNPNGPWTLVQGTSALPADPDWTPLSNVDNAYNPPGGRHIKQPAFAPSNQTGEFLPAWFKAAVTPETSGYGWRKGDLIVHSTDNANGMGEGIAAAVFAAPTTGKSEISGYVYNARNLNRPQAWILSHDGVTLASGLLPGDGSITRSTKHVFKIKNVDLTVGDTVMLQIYENGGDSGDGDYVGNDLKVVYP